MVYLLRGLAGESRHVDAEDPGGHVIPCTGGAAGIVTGVVEVTHVHGRKAELLADASHTLRDGQEVVHQ